MRFWITLLMLLSVYAATAEKTTPPAKQAIPADSIYQLNDKFTDQNAKDFQLASRSGQVQLVAMFYSSCQYACPLIIDSAKGVQRALTPALRGKLAVLLISFDPARDSPEVLAALAVQRKLERSGWTLARTPANGVRKVAALLGIRYRELANGEFNHSSQLILLDAHGRLLARTEKMGGVPDPEFMQAVEKALVLPANPSR